jgi:DNA topoisomerase-1
MTDADQEGDVIAWDVARVLGEMPNGPEIVLRAPLTGLDEASVEAAIENAQAVQATSAIPGRIRAMVDRVIGAVFSHDGVTVGRVSTALLGGVASSKTPLGEAVLSVRAADGGEPFTARMDYSTPEQEEQLRAVLANADRLPAMGSAGETVEQPKPWEMSGMLLAASKKLGLSLADASRLLQDMYEGGQMNYPRTSQTHVSKAGIDLVKQVARDNGLRIDSAALEELEDADGTRRKSHEALRPLSAVNPCVRLSTQTPADAMMVMAMRRLIESADRPRVESGDASGLPGGLSQLAWTRKTARRYPWSREDAVEPGLTRYAPDAAVLKAMVDLGIGRPSTWVSHASKFVSRDLVTQDMAMTAKAGHWHFQSPDPLLHPKFSATVEKLLEGTAGGSGSSAKDLNQEMLKAGDLEAMVEEAVATGAMKILSMLPTEMRTQVAERLEPEETARDAKVREEVKAKVEKAGREVVEEMFADAMEQHQGPKL